MRHYQDIVHPLKVVWLFCVLYAARFSPSFRFKNFLYRLIGVKVGKDVSVGLGVMLDIFFPDQIEIGENVVIGYNTTVLGPEFLVRKWRIGRVIIEKDVTIGANCTILHGVIIHRLGCCARIAEIWRLDSFGAGQYILSSGSQPDGRDWMLVASHLGLLAEGLVYRHQLLAIPLMYGIAMTWFLTIAVYFWGRRILQTDNQ